MADDITEDIPSENESYGNFLEYETSLMERYLEDPEDTESVAEAVVYFSDGDPDKFEGILNDLQRTATEHQRFRENSEGSGEEVDL